jgi:SAM-dependent methyltransferase
VNSSELVTFIRGLVQEKQLLACSLSKLRKKASSFQRVSVRPLELKGDLMYQMTYHQEQKELHENLTPAQTAERITELMDGVFRQGVFFTPQADWQVLVSKKGALKILRHPPSRQVQELDMKHNRTKNYLLQEGTPYPFLVELGVMNETGQVLAKRYHKFRQLNKYLEVVESCIPCLEERGDRNPLTIVDFGSGKAYLTFALYHYLVEHLQRNVRIIGLDLKEDVVAFCNTMAAKLGFEHLSFSHQDIRDFQAQGQIDMVVSLHACDVATDYALAQAVKWGAQVILAVPCCQHEVFAQLDEEVEPVLFRHGIVKERVAALLTDAARAKLLEMEGYEVRVMEFIDLEHTPKNLLIRGFKERKNQKQQDQEYEKFKEVWGIAPTLESLLTKKG